MRLKTIFKDYQNIFAVYIFGSLVSGNLHKKSDVDFAILSKDNINKDELIYRLEKALNFKMPVQTINLNKQNLIFQHNVIRTGKILHEENRQTRVRFEVQVMKEFNELEPKLNFLEKRIISSIIKNL